MAFRIRDPCGKRERLKRAQVPWWTVRLCIAVGRAEAVGIIEIRGEAARVGLAHDVSSDVIEAGLEQVAVGRVQPAPDGRGINASKETGGPRVSVQAASHVGAAN